MADTLRLWYVRTPGSDTAIVYAEDEVQARQLVEDVWQSIYAFTKTEAYGKRAKLTVELIPLTGLPQLITWC